MTLLNSTKITLTNTMIIGVIITICSNNWIAIWTGIEIVLLSFIPLIQNRKNSRSESIIKYFIIQRVASTMFLLRVVIMLIGVNIINEMLITIAIVIKIGLAPFHNWVISIIEGIEYTNVLILLTVLKIPPIIILYHTNTKLLTIPILLRIILRSIICLNQSSVRKTLAYSSIYNNRLIVIPINKFNILLIYIIIYSIIVIIVILVLNPLKINFINQLVFNEINIRTKIVLWFNMLSIRGFPITLGFIGKIIIIQTIILQKRLILLLINLITSILLTIFYLRLTFTSIFRLYSFKKWSNFNNKPKIFVIWLNFIIIPLTMSIVVIY